MLRKVLRVIATALPIVAMVLAMVGAPTAALASTTQTFSNTSPITISDKSPCTGSPGKASAYPWNITVSGMPGTATKVTVTLSGITESSAKDLDVLLVGPTQATLVILSDNGNASATSNVNLTLDDAAATILPATDAGPLVSGTFRPSNSQSTTDSFPSPAPSNFTSAAPVGSATFASIFNGTNPNGTWSLYVVDDSCSSGVGGSIASGWGLNFTTTSDAATSPNGNSTPHPSLT